jgi:hypothetical protein
MRNMLNALLAGLTILVAAALIPAGHAAEPESPALQPYEAEYQARSSGLSATAHRSLEKLDAERYRLNNRLSLTIAGATIGSVSETSDFISLDNALRPINYSFVQTGPGKRSESVAFDWNSGIAQVNEERRSVTLDTAEGLMDKLSFSAQLSVDLAALAAAELIEGRDFVYRVVDGRKIEEQRYSIMGTEEIETPSGRVQALRIERVRDADARRSTSFWLDPARHFLLVRLEQTNSSGALTELALRRVKFD